MQVGQLFSPQHAVRAVQAFKARNWSQIEFLELLGTAKSYAPLSKLAPVARNTLFAHMPYINNPIVREECLSLLEYHKLSSWDKETVADDLCKSLLSSEDVEQACVSFLRSPNLGSDVLNMLIEAGATDLTPQSDAMWSKMLEICLVNQNFERVKSLWNVRPTNASFWVSEFSALKLVETAGRLQDPDFLESVLRGTRGELPLTSGSLAASLECFLANPTELLDFIQRNEALISSTVAITDLRFVAEALVPQIMQVLDKRDVSSLIGNLLLLGLYRKQTSNTVFHVFRYLRQHKSFVPNRITAQILANSAYRLGNSKLLIFEIWKEMAENNVPLDRKFFETAIVCQLVGPKFDTVQFFLAEMARQKITVRTHIQQLIFNKLERLGNTSLMLQILKPNLKLRNQEFPYEEAALESPDSQQARANAQLFIDGKSPTEEPLAVLSGMLDFDSRRAAKFAKYNPQ